MHSLSSNATPAMDSLLSASSIPFSASAKIFPENDASTDPRLPLLNLSMLQQRVDSLQHFLYENVRRNTFIGRDQMDLVSNEISSAIQQVILDGIALLACYPQDGGKLPQPKDQVGKAASIGSPSSSSSIEISDKKQSVKDEIDDGDYEIVELGSVELLAVNIHRCEICGKRFKRDANLRMHKRAHGNQFKTLEALTRSDREERGKGFLKRKIRFSCPFIGCNRNKSHIAFKPLKSAICVKNHFKRSHCPKLFSCNRCNNKSFSVVADLKSHQKNCGKYKWRCSCGFSFPRKAKLFGHVSLFEEGHMPAFIAEGDVGSKKATRNKRSRVAREAEDEDDEEEIKPNPNSKRADGNGMLLNEILQLESFGSIIGAQQCSSSKSFSSSGDSVSVSGVDEFQIFSW